MSLIAHDAGLHAYHVVHRSLLPSLHVATLLHLGSLEEVAGVILIADCQRYDMEREQALLHRSFASHRHHLENGFLCAVVGVFGASLTLCYPDVVVLLADNEVHVVCHAL